MGESKDRPPTVLFWATGIIFLNFIVLIYRTGTLDEIHFLPSCNRTLSSSKISHIHPIWKAVAELPFLAEGRGSGAISPDPYLCLPLPPHLPGASRHPQSLPGKQSKRDDLSGSFSLENFSNLRSLRKRQPLFPFLSSSSKQRHLGKAILSH